MAVLNFYLRGSKEPKSIYLRYIPNSDQDFKINTRLKINSKYWSTAKKQINSNSDFPEKYILMEELNRILTSISLYETKRSIKNTSANKEELIKIVKNKSENIDLELLTQQIECYANHLTSTRSRDKPPGAVKTYNTTKSRVKKFEEQSQYKVKMSELSFSFYKEYLDFARDKLGLAENSIGKDIKNIKTVALFAMENGYIINQNVLSKKFKAPSEKTLFTTLKPEELEKLNKYTGKTYLMRARNWLIIGCWTGCRVKDLMSLTRENISYHKGKKVIKYTQSKTEKTVIIPVHPHIEEVLERNKGEFPKPISDVKFNKYIKELCKEVGIDQEIKGSRIDPKTKRKIIGTFPKWELIRSHTCRRSFATNFYGKIPITAIRSVTGHSSEKMLLTYIQETEYDHIDDIFSAMNSIELK